VQQAWASETGGSSVGAGVTGRKEGLLVGFFVGFVVLGLAVVGASVTGERVVGRRDGEEVGELVFTRLIGAPVTGDCVGATVGLLVGGEEVGAADGAVVGVAEVGDGVMGAPVGAREGFVVGNSVMGESVGPLVGVAVGDAVGASIGEDVGLDVIGATGTAVESSPLQSDPFWTGQVPSKHPSTESTDPSAKVASNFTFTPLPPIPDNCAFHVAPELRSMTYELSFNVSVMATTDVVPPATSTFVK